MQETGRSLPWRRIWNVLHAYHFKTIEYKKAKRQLMELGLHEVEACYVLYQTARFGYELKRFY